MTYFLTILAVHLIMAISVAAFTWNLAASVPGGLFLAIVAPFYLLIEAPLVSLGLFLISNRKTQNARLAIAIVGTIIASCLGYFCCFKVGGTRPEYLAMGFSIGGFFSGVLVSIVGIKLAIKQQSEQDVAPDG